MKIYRLITFVAAVLVTVFIARVLIDVNVGSPDQVKAVAAQAP
jgi:hypothetical protein